MNNRQRYTKQRLVSVIVGTFFNLVGMALPRYSHFVFCSSHTKDFSYDAKYLFLSMFKKPSYAGRVFFLVNDARLRAILVDQYGPYFITTSSVLGFWKVVTAKGWVCSTLETPFNGFFAGFRRKNLHLGHGTLFKTVGLTEKKQSFLKKAYYRLNPTKFYRWLAASGNQVEKVASSFGVSPSSVLIDEPPRIQFSREHLKQPPRGSLLYAPTWRKNKKDPLFRLDLEDINNVLKSSRRTLYLKFHPMFEQEQLKRSYSNIVAYSAFFAPDIYQEMSSFEGLITDASSLALDFAALGLPVFILTNPDDDFAEEVGFFADIGMIIQRFINKNNDLSGFMYSPDEHKEMSKLLTGEIGAATGKLDAFFH